MRRLISSALAVLLVAAALWAGAGQAWAGGFCGIAGCSGGGSLAGTTLSALGGVSLSSKSPLEPGRGTLTTTDRIDVPPCWYQPGLTPAQAEQLVRNLSRLVYANPELQPWFQQYIQPIVAAGYHLNDKGLWYHAWCTDFNAPAAAAWTTTNPWFVWVAATNPAPPPAGTVSLDPKTLATYAIDSIVLPATTFSRNPLLPTGNPAQPVAAVVNLATWIWLPRGTFGTVSVTATAGPVTVIATASPAELQLPTSLPDTQLTPSDGTCTSLYDAYAGNAAAAPGCAMTFGQSSAREPGQAYQVTIRLVWQAKYTSNIGAGGPLQSGTVAGTVAVPVQELQTTITNPSRSAL